MSCQTPGVLVARTGADTSHPACMQMEPSVATAPIPPSVPGGQGYMPLDIPANYSLVELMDNPDFALLEVAADHPKGTWPYWPGFGDLPPNLPSDFVVPCHTFDGYIAVVGYPGEASLALLPVQLHPGPPALC